MASAELPRARDVMLSAVWALDDFTAANGGTGVVPASHLGERGRPPPSQAVPVEMLAGSVLLFPRPAVARRRGEHQHRSRGWA